VPVNGAAAGLEAWAEALRARHTEALTFTEIRKGVVALSRIYVEERNRIANSVFDGAGKRAAFACFYSPLHYLLVRNIVVALGAQTPPPSRIIDLGCGLMAGGGAWAHASGSQSKLVGIDQSAWAVSEARDHLKHLGLRGKLLHQRIDKAPMPTRGEALVAAFAVNELSDDLRGRLLRRLLESTHRDASVLIIEPIARRANRWWMEWSGVFDARGGRTDEWRFPVELPSFVAELDRASGLNHRELSGRSIFFSPQRGSS
jgi:hypothetical protein